MMDLQKLTINDIENMDYNHLIALVKETNRPPGGYKTIACVIQNTFMKQGSRVLEIGTSTGVTAIELVKACGCFVEAIDINETSLTEAQQRALQEGVAERIHFQQEDAQALCYEPETFDLVFCGNVTSLIPDREKAREEYTRVLKKNGFLAAVPMYYLRQPSEELRSCVSAAIQSEVAVIDRDYWIDFYNRSGLVLKFTENYKFDYIPDKILEEFVEAILGRPFLRELKPEVYERLREKYKEYIYLFRDNLSHMGYSILLYKKEPVNREPELFHGSLITDEVGI
jgi:ubiquinone/menaquinone biosynthesis C-methylase UbiE